MADSTRTAGIHHALASKDLLPAVHLVDAGYVTAELLVSSPDQYGIARHGPVRPDTSWQAKAPDAYGLDALVIDWERLQATCPHGHTSIRSSSSVKTSDAPLIHFIFSRPVCRQCPEQARCTRSRDEPRKLGVRPYLQYEALQAVRHAQQTEPWTATYQQRPTNSDLPTASWD